MNGGEQGISPSSLFHWLKQEGTKQVPEDVDKMQVRCMQQAYIMFLYKIHVPFFYPPLFLLKKTKNPLPQCHHQGEWSKNEALE